jgi:hypothetical protein
VRVAPWSRRVSLALVLAGAHGCALDWDRYHRDGGPPDLSTDAEAGADVDARTDANVDARVDARVDGGATDAPDGTDAPEAGPNLLANPSFEQDLEGWLSYQGTLTRVLLADAPDGRYVAHVVVTSGMSATLDDATPAVAAFTPGRRYAATAYVRAASSSAVGLRATITLREGVGTPSAHQTASPSVALSNTFQMVSVTVTTMPPAGTLDLYVAVSGAAAGDAFYVDDVTLRELLR